MDTHICVYIHILILIYNIYTYTYLLVVLKFCLMSFDSLFIQIKDWCVSLDNWPIYHSVMPLLCEGLVFFLQIFNKIHHENHLPSLWKDVKLTNSISLPVTCLFIFLFLTESLLVIDLFRNLSISSKFYNLLVWCCLYIPPYNYFNCSTLFSPGFGNLCFLLVSWSVYLKGHQFCWSFQIANLCFHWSIAFVFYVTDIYSNLHFFLPSLALDLVYWLLSGFLRWNLGLLTWALLPSFLILVFIAIDFTLSNILVYSMHFELLYFIFIHFKIF